MPLAVNGMTEIGWACCTKPAPWRMARPARDGGGDDNNGGGGGECRPGPAHAWGLASAQRSTPTAREDAFHCLVSEGALWMTPLAWGGGGGAPCVLAACGALRARLLDRVHLFAALGPVRGGWLVPCAARGAGAARAGERASGGFDRAAQSGASRGPRDVTDSALACSYYPS